MLLTAGILLSILTFFWAVAVLMVIQWHGDDKQEIIAATIFHIVITVFFWIGYGCHI